MHLEREVSILAFSLARSRCLLQEGGNETREVALTLTCLFWCSLHQVIWQDHLRDPLVIEFALHQQRLGDTVLKGLYCDANHIPVFNPILFNPTKMFMNKTYVRLSSCADRSCPLWMIRHWLRSSPCMFNILSTNLCRLNEAVNGTSTSYCRSPARTNTFP